MVSIDKRVLVVDDEEIVRDSCKRALTDAGYEVHTVASGRDALEACRAEPFDLMLTDLKMPDMDGVEVIRAVANEFPGLRVVVITGYPTRESVEQAEELGVSNYLEKPLSPGRLSEATAEALVSPARFKAPVLPPAASDAAAVTPTKVEVRGSAEAAPALPEVAKANVAVRDVAAFSQPEESESNEAAETEVSTLKTIAMLAAAPIIGGAYVALLPAIGFGILVSAVGMGLAAKIGWVQK